MKQTLESAAKVQISSYFLSNEICKLKQMRSLLNVLHVTVSLSNYFISGKASR